MKLSLIFIAIPVLLIGACRHTSLIDPSIHTISTECSSDTVYFQNDIYPLIISNCAKAGCHTTNGDEEARDLSTYQKIFESGYVKPYNSGDSKLVEAIKSEGGEDKMPPSPNAPFTSSQIALIEKWIDQGAFNNECAGGNCDTLAVTYSITIAGIMNNYCTGCHGMTDPSGGIDLTNYNGISASAENGSLYGSVSHTPGYTAMPYGGNLLPECKIDEVRIWIEDGYPNN